MALANGKRFDLAGVAVHAADRRHYRVDLSANEVLHHAGGSPLYGTCTVSMPAASVEQLAGRSTT